MKRNINTTTKKIVGAPVRKVTTTNTTNIYSNNKIAISNKSLTKIIIKPEPSLVLTPSTVAATGELIFSGSVASLELLNQNGKPEIIALTEFLPCYDDNNNFTDAGEFFDAKQNAKLISAIDSIKNIFSLIEQQKALEKIEDEITIKKLLEGNRIEILNFCNSIDENISAVVASIENAKKVFNFKANFVKANDLNIPDDLKNDVSITDIITIEQDWSATKTWLQLCLEFKEALKRGTSKDNSLFMMNLPSLPNTYKDSFTINDPATRGTKLEFNKVLEFNESLFNGEYNLSNTDSYNLLQTNLAKIFKESSFSILNVNMKDVVGGDRSKNLARLSYMIAKETRYSSSLRRLNYSNSSILGNYAYEANNLNKTNNTIFWDYVVGKTGTDITEIPNANYNNSNLTGISQKRISTSDVTNEILTFESSYINDNVGNTQRDAVFTPGARYYIESREDPNSLFSTIRAKELNDHVKRALDAFKDMFVENNTDSQFLFSTSISLCG